MQTCTHKQQTSQDTNAAARGRVNNALDRTIFSKLRIIRTNEYTNIVKALLEYPYENRLIAIKLSVHGPSNRAVKTNRKRRAVRQFIRAIYRPTESRSAHDYAR